jgi:hypothetical protein
MQNLQVQESKVNDHQGGTLGAHVRCGSTSLKEGRPQDNQFLENSIVQPAGASPRESRRRIRAALIQPESLVAEGLLCIG